MLFLAFLAAADVVAQASPQVITIGLDPAKVIVGAATGLGVIILGGLKWLAGRTIGSIEDVGRKVKEIDTKVTKIDHELFGPDGKNGMRSDVKRMSRQIDVHHDVLVQLAQAQGLDVPERVP